MTKLILVILILSLASILYGQDSRQKTIIITPKANSTTVFSLDTIYFKSENNRIIKVLFNISTKDSFITIQEVPHGKYYIEFSCKGMSFEPILATVCSKCKNQFEYFADSAFSLQNQPTWTYITESPRYIGGNINLTKDFKKILSIAELKKLKKSPEFKVSFYLTSSCEISDVIYAPDNISNNIKEIITKGLYCTKRWVAGKINGNPSDEMFSIYKSELLND